MSPAREPTHSSAPLPDELEAAVFDLRALPGNQRTAALEQLCAKYPEHESAIRVLGAMTSALDPGIPDTIGPFRILRVLGEGGMGTVYLAGQDEPVKRRVALKVVKLGMDSRPVLARFEIERRALAVMNHDAIARVFDAGSTDRGQPYFVMEYVEGLPLIEYCSHHRLTLSQRIDVIREICAGVQHAHQKGVIHRDLKPSNVLVAQSQGRHVPKIIDFGLARATDRDSVDWSLVTQQGQMLGTPAYMSPEQAMGSDTDIDTRTDVYALGVILYELLTGQLPFSIEELARYGLAEMHRTVREVQPPKPSTRISTAGDDASTHASSCGTTAPALRRALRGELDWIVMRAIEKEPRRRYGSASDLAADLRRFQDHEAVTARPVSIGYRAQKFVRRNRVQVAALLAVITTLIAGITGTWMSLVEANVAKRTAEVNLSKFELLSRVVELREIRTRATALIPPWPENAGPLRELLDVDLRAIVQELPNLKTTLSELRETALEPTADEIAARRRRHPKAQELARKRRERDALQLADRVRNGHEGPPPFALDAATKTLPEPVLFNRAMQLVVPKRRIFGRESEGLAIARHLLEKNPKGRRLSGIALAYSLLALGFDDEARAEVRLALATAPRNQQIGVAKKLDLWIEQAKSPGSARRLAKLDEQVAKLEVEVDRRVSWRMRNDSTQFLHDTLAKLVTDIEEFDRDHAPEIRRRLAWASRIEQLSITKHEARWAEARDAIRRADGVVASKAYAKVPIDLTPQVGLVPIGMNPRTKLWEFYHLASVMQAADAIDQIEIPVHAEDGSIEVDPANGIVFVLVPGGSFMMGAQRDNRRAANYDRFAMGTKADPVSEAPAHPITLAPCFLARYEMTKGQWKQLTGESPSGYYRIGKKYNGVPTGVGYDHPAESVDWRECSELLSEFGLVLPTEAQWEYACRAGTRTPWFTGLRRQSLEKYANIRDRSAEKFYPLAGKADVKWDDGYAGPAPVGKFLPSPWGFFDMHGNVAEWCRDGGSYMHEPALGDGERRDPRTDKRTRIQRGGSHSMTSIHARVSARRRANVDWHSPAVGVRPARKLLDRR